MPQLGQLKARLTLTVPTKTTGASGGADYDYTVPPATEIRVFAQKLAERRQQEALQGREVPRSFARFMIHFRNTVTMKTRITYEGLTYDIVGIDHDNNRQWTTLYAELRIED